MARQIPDFLILTPALAAKLAAVVVHAREMVSQGGHEFDRVALQSVASDPEVQDWIQRCGPLAPRPR